MIYGMYSITNNVIENMIKEVCKANDKIGGVYLPRDWIGKKLW